MTERGDRPFAVFDIDGTVIRWQLYHSMADNLARMGFMDSKNHQLIKDARMIWKRRAGGFSDYEKVLIESFDQTVVKLSMAQLEAVVEAVFDEYKEQAYTFTRDLITKLKADGYLLFAVSGSPVQIVSKVAAFYGFDAFAASEYEYLNKKFTGQKRVIAREKRQALEALIKKFKAGSKNSLGVGDTYSDIPMLEIVDRPIAFNPERRLFAHAKSHGWEIVLERKDMVYKLRQAKGKYELAETD